MYAVINGKWSHLDGEPLTSIDQHQLSKQINNIKPIAQLTHSDNLPIIFHIINIKSKSVNLINKLINQDDKTIELINAKL